MHRAAVTPRRAPDGGWWTITSPSLADFPMQSRMVSVRATRTEARAWRPGCSTWRRTRWPTRARELAFLDAQGGRPAADRGRPADRNVSLWRAAPGEIVANGATGAAARRAP